MPLKVGLVGLGHIGDLHAESYLNDPLAELVAVCDVQKDKAEGAAAKYKTRAYASVKEMLASEDLDIVDVATGGYEAGGWHFEPTMEALASGKHVLCEKPLSNRIEECREMVRFAAERNLCFGCNLNHTFTQTANLADRYLSENKIGEPIYALFKAGFDGGELTYNGQAGLPFTHIKAFLTHPFSVMRHFCGEIAEVQAFVRTPDYRKAYGDPILSVNSIHIRFANGSAGYLISQRGDAVYGLGGWWSFELAGSRGTFCIENCTERITYWGAPTAEGKPAPVVTDTGVKTFETTFPDRIHAFLEDVAVGRPDRVRASGRDALATMECVFAVIESYENAGALCTVRS